MIRLDVLVVQKGIAGSRQRAKELIENEQILVNGIACTKASKSVAETVELTLQGERLRYVGRGGLKLEYMLQQQKICLNNMVCMDIGASTGGFTDCMLQHGAKKVYAIDVGHDQLVLSLRQHPQVVCMEKTDIRTLSRAAIAEEIHFISVDVSFISLKLILPAISLFLSQYGTAVLLIKPQFEAGRTDIGKNGIVKSKAVHVSVIQTILLALEQQHLFANFLCPSPIAGGSGNLEYLVLVTRKMTSSCILPVEAVVEQAFSLKKKKQK